MGTYSNITIENDQFYSLEKHFEIACNRHPHLKLLESQWRFDQELVSKALQNINTIFPHYSRHDASHSKQIIVNIERMLGDKIKYLSATDTWLILEAAYHHDIGMVITQKQIEDMNTEEFKDFVTQISKEKENELCEFAENWLNKKAILPQNAEAHSFFHQYTQLLAEWYRRKHPYNSARIVRDPFEEIGLNSPRNELLPKRLFQVLSNICKAHGDDFENVKKLPKAEAGMASEDCHPLYVACLIRMGDLLDVDDNRFCPVMMKMCGSNLPNTSLAHFHKHQSISHFRLDSEQIEITCECPTPESYEVAFDWFSWMSKEYKNQTQYWNNIVPYKELGRLPTLIEPIVKIDKPYFILKEGKKPEFLINQKAIMDLVRGANLYSSKFESIREVLQNSVDATILRVWIEHNEEIDKIDPTSSRLYEIYDQYKIKVDVENFDENYWVINIIDKGIGIDIATLNFMFEVGSSYKNIEKLKLLDDMPDWFKPSGNFGIGFQSLFLISDYVELKSRHVNEKKGLEVKFKNKNSKVELVISENYEKLEIGTILKIKVRKGLFKKDLGYDFYQDLLSDNKRIVDIEFNDLELEVRCINEKISNFFKYSPITREGVERDEKVVDYFKNNLILHSVDFKKRDQKKDWSKNITLCYRGQVVSDEARRFQNTFSSYINFAVDLYGYNAKEILTYSRNEFLPEKAKEIRKIILETLIEYTVEKFDQIPDVQKNRASSFLYSNGYEDKKNEKYLEHIYNRSIEIGGNNILFLEIIKKLTEENYYWGGVTHEIFEKSGISSDKYLGYNLNSCSSDDVFLIHQIIQDLGYSHTIHTDVDDEACDILSYNIDSKFYFSKEIFKKVLESHIEEESTKYFICYIWKGFEDLAIKRIPYYYPLYSYSHTSEVLLLPVYWANNSFEFEDSSKFNKWVFDNRKKSDVSFDRIVQLNKELEEIIKELL